MINMRHLLSVVPLGGIVVLPVVFFLLIRIPYLLSLWDIPSGGGLRVIFQGEVFISMLRYPPSAPTHPSFF